MLALCGCRESARPRRRLPADALDPRGSAPPRRRRFSIIWRPSPIPIAALRLAPAPPRAGDDWTNFIGAIADISRSGWPADIERARLWYEPHLEPHHEMPRPAAPT
jgi:hypothetical protein